MDKESANQKPFLSDVKTLRERARQNLSDGAITKTYGGDVKKTIEILQQRLESRCVSAPSFRPAVSALIEGERGEIEARYRARKLDIAARMIAEPVHDEQCGLRMWHLEGAVMQAYAAHSLEHAVMFCHLAISD